MIFREQTYSVLIVSASDKFNTATLPLLPSNIFWPVHTVDSAGEARRKLPDMDYDMVLVNTPLPDEFGTYLAEDICTSYNAGVLMFVKGDMYDEIFAEVVSYGAMVLPKPTSTQMVSQSLRMLCSSRERMKAMEARQATVEDKIKEIRIINKAKWLLIDNLKMTEEQAHHYIEKQAMNQRMTRLEAAENVIRTYSS